MKKEDFFEEWKGDWKERKVKFQTNQAELFRHIRDKPESSRIHQGKRTRVARKPNKRNT
ncbi:MAG: hypothetical protein KAT65_29275 [Methanophagales archaeon]|nr:hypothetical protein [Methanophagales archaeon]